MNTRFEEVEVDFCVIGGGVAGICAAIAAARRGNRVALVQNRSLLGGNASSEIRQSIGGACFTGHYPDAREGGIVDELWSAIRRKCLGGDVNDYAEASVVLWEACRQVPGLRLFLNTHICDIERNQRRLEAVEGLQMSTGLRFRFKAQHFADCTGDANVAYLAGCAFMSGQESRAAFNESLAPEIANSFTMGNTILFQAEKLEVPVPYERPEWVPDLRQKECYWTMYPPKSPMSHGLWTFEYGGQLDTIRDAEKIQEELLKILYGAWADLKSRPECGMENYRLTFISSLPGKRESRRVIGDYVLTQNDIVESRRFPDDVAYAGWALDLHNPEGFYGKDRPTTFYFFPEIHSIPLRSLYARDLDNLWLAGRDISVTHIALGGARLMASCGIAGEAVGTAAALAIRGRHSCREMAEKHVGQVQQQILKDGGFIPGVRNEDPMDLARIAQVEASSEAILEAVDPTEFLPIGSGLGIAFPIVEGRLDAFRLSVRNESQAPVTVRAVLQPIRTMRDFHPTRVIQEVAATANPGDQWLSFDFKVPLENDLWMIHFFSSDPTLQVGHIRERVTGVHAADFHPEGKKDEWARQLGMPEPALWVRRFNEKRTTLPQKFHPTPCFEISPPQKAYRPGNVINGINRPQRLPNLWVSNPGQAFPQTLVLQWKTPVEISEVRILFDADMDLPSPPIEPLATLAASYELTADLGNESTTLVQVSDNRQRLAVHSFPRNKIDSLTLTIHRNHSGGREARVCEIRCY